MLRLQFCAWELESGRRGREEELQVEYSLFRGKTQKKGVPIMVGDYEKKLCFYL